MMRGDHRPYPSFYGRPPWPTVLLLRLPKHRDPKPLNSRAIDDLIASLPTPIRPVNPLVYPSGTVAAKLFFRYLPDALDAVAHLWGRRLDGAHFLFPKIDNRFTCFVEELQRVKQVFITHIESLLDGEAVNKCKKRAEEVERKVRQQAELLGRPRRVNVQMELREEKERLEVELEQINGRLEEFRVSMRSMLNYLGDGKYTGDLEDQGEVEVFNFKKDLDLAYLVRIHAMVMRECRRLSDGLPIYAWRRKILRATWSKQVHERLIFAKWNWMVLVT